jgi:Xaa-Pro aminopeptidase
LIDAGAEYRGYDCDVTRTYAVAGNWTAQQAELRAIVPGHVVTVEPGIYFVPALLNNPERRNELRTIVAWDAVDRMLGFGGIRIEDNVLITDSGHEVLTATIPLG